MKVRAVHPHVETDERRGNGRCVDKEGKGEPSCRHVNRHCTECYRNNEETIIEAK